MELATPAHYLSLVLGFLFLLFLDRHVWFNGDIFEFIARMQPGHSLDLLVPHNEHWSTIPILLTLGLYKLFGVSTYTPYVVLDVVCHIAVTHLLWRWMRRLGVDAWVATALAGVFLVVGGGVDNLTTGFQVSFVLPVALGLLGAFLIDYSGPTRWTRDIGWWAIAVIAVMTSGIGVCMAIVAAGLALLRRGWRAALQLASVPGLVYLVWLALFGRGHISTTPGPKYELTLVLDYVWTGLTSAIEGTTGWAGAGAVLALGLGVWLFLNRREALGPRAMAFAAPLAALIFFTIVGIGRISLGIQEAASTRYGYEWIALLLPATGLALTQLCRWPAGRWLALGLAAVAAYSSVGSLVSWLESINPLSQMTEGEILAAAHLISSGAPLAVGDGAQVYPVTSPDVSVGVLRSMIAQDKLPMGQPVTAQDLLDASLYLQVSVTATPLGPGVPPSVGADVRPLPLPAGPGCVSVAAGDSQSQIRLVFASAGSVSITPTGGGDLQVQLARRTDPLDLTASSSFPVAPRATVYLNVTATGMAPIVSLPPGLSTVCGVSGS